tara:strand:- start:661 stop:1077 length:417 start_codon:yes stop_codon:yes gene_type:complete
MPEQPEILSQIDTGFDSYKDAIIKAQNLHMEAYGKYWQGLWTHKETPTGGLTPPDNLDQKPTDEIKTWEEVLSAYQEIQFPSQMLSRMRIDTYVDLEGHGYVIFLETETASDIWQKRINIRQGKIVSNEWINVPKVMQ